MNSPTPEQVLQERTNADLTQTEAAAIVHAVLGTWQQWEKGKRNMHPAFWELFLLKTAKVRKHKQFKKLENAQPQSYDPWIAGRMLSKFDQYLRWPTETELGEWIDGFINGCVDLGEYQMWQAKLAEYTNGKNAPDYLLKLLLPHT